MDSLKGFFEELENEEDQNDEEEFLDLQKQSKFFNHKDILNNKNFFIEENDEKKEEITKPKVKSDFEANINVNDLLTKPTQEEQSIEQQVQKKTDIFDTDVQIKKQPLSTSINPSSEENEVPQSHFLKSKINVDLENSGLRQIKSTPTIKGKFNVNFHQSNIEIENEVKKYLAENNLNLDLLVAIIESVIFVKGSEGLHVVEIQKVCDLPLNILNSIIDQMIIQKDNNPQSGLCIRKFGHRIKLLSKKETFNGVSKILSKDYSKLINKNKLIVLSIIAYNQPCSKTFINNIRRKDSTNILHTLLEDNLVVRTKKTANRYVYSVTQKFYDKCGIKNLNDLPKLSKKIDLDSLQVEFDDNNVIDE